MIVGAYALSKAFLIIPADVPPKKTSAGFYYLTERFSDYLHKIMMHTFL